MPEGTNQPCPSCGISVMVGYVKCPKCHAPMPGSTTGRNRRASMAGGTTSERIDVLADEGRGGGMWWLAGVVVIGVGVAVWATQCRGTRRATAPAAAVTDTQPAAGTAQIDDTAPDQRPAPVAPGGPDPAYAADALEGELAGERLYATVQVVGEILDVRSAFCNEVRLGEIVGRHAAELKGSGVQRVRCSETYGTQVFERGL